MFSATPNLHRQHKILHKTPPPPSPLLRADFVIGRGSSTAMGRSSNPMLFLLQVGSQNSYPRVERGCYCLLLSRSGTLLALCCCVTHSIDVLCTLILILSGDVELNPVPVSGAQLMQFNDMFRLLQDANARPLRFEEGQASLINFVGEITKKEKQLQMEKNAYGC